MSNRKNHPKPNGYAGQQGHVNGRAPASSERGGILVPRDRAASDDARRTSSAMDACTTAPGTDCAAYAEVAPPPSGKTVGKMKKDGKNLAKGKNGERSKVKDFHVVGSTDLVAMRDGAAYVNSVASRVDLVGASARLVYSDDEKISKAELDRLREMKFGKPGAAMMEETPRLDFSDWPRPAR